MRRYLVLITSCLILSCKSKDSTTNSISSNDKTKSNIEDTYIDKYNKDTSIYVMYSNIAYVDSTCPEKKLWSRIELHKQDKIILIDSGVLVSPTFGWIQSSNNLIYSYRQMMISKDDFDEDVNSKKNFCTLDAPLFAHLDYDVSRETELILCNLLNLSLEGSLEELSRKGYEFDTVRNAWIIKGEEDNGIYSLNDIIYKDITYMENKKKNITEDRIAQYVSLVEENNLMNTGYKNDFLSLFKMIMKYGNTKEKQLITKFVD